MVQYRCARCQQKIMEHPFYKLKYEKGSTEIYLCPSCVRTWLNSWPKNIPTEDPVQSTLSKTPEAVQ